jgi:hypothetical protein
MFHSPRAGSHSIASSPLDVRAVLGLGSDTGRRFLDPEHQGPNTKELPVADGEVVGAVHDAQQLVQHARGRSPHGLVVEMKKEHGPLL